MDVVSHVNEEVSTKSIHIYRYMRNLYYLQHFWKNRIFSKKIAKIAILSIFSKFSNISQFVSQNAFKHENYCTSFWTRQQNFKSIQKLPKTAIIALRRSWGNEAARHSWTIVEKFSCVKNFSKLHNHKLYQLSEKYTVYWNKTRPSSSDLLMYAILLLFQKHQNYASANLYELELMLLVSRIYQHYQH